MSDNPLISNVKKIKRLMGWMGYCICSDKEETKNFDIKTTYNDIEYNISLQNITNNDTKKVNYFLKINSSDNRELTINIKTTKSEDDLFINITYKIDENNNLKIIRILNTKKNATYILRQFEYQYLKKSIVKYTNEDTLKYPLLNHEIIVYLEGDENDPYYKRTLNILEKVKFTDEELTYLTDVFRDTFKKLDGQYVDDEETKRFMEEAEEYANTLSPKQESALRRVLYRRYQKNRRK